MLDSGLARVPVRNGLPNPRPARGPRRRSRDRAPGTKPRALLALLLLHANETLTADRLIDELWGERPPAAPGKTLQMHISRLRKALGGEDGAGAAGSIATRERGYRLEIDPEQLDSHRFEALVAQGRAELAADRPSRGRPRSKRPWRSGMARRWRTSPTRRSPRPRSRAWTTCGSRPWSSSWRRSSRSAATPRWWSSSSP